MHSSYEENKEERHHKMFHCTLVHLNIKKGTKIIILVNVRELCKTHNSSFVNS